MKIAYTTACVFPDTNPIWALRDSCQRFGIELQPYGLGGTYIDWRDIKIVKFVAFAKRLISDGYTHCFYTDGRDSFMLAGREEIEAKYKYLGSPPYVVSCEDQCYPFASLWENFPDPGHPWRYIGAGQYMGELAYMVDMWAKLEALYKDIPNENHDQGWLELGYVEGHLDPKQFVLDTRCSIFQCVREGLGKPISESNLRIIGQRVHNRLTETMPCALHFPGGYSDPITGKDHVLKPVWEALGWNT